MGKKGLADKVRHKRKEKAKQAPNPFEVKVNKVKHVVVNKKVQSWEKGLPGVSRSKAIKKRKDTLLRELHHSKKSNSLLDKRFGEGDDSMTADEKMVQRFALEKKKQMRDGDFNLDNEEVLTHYGQSLAENLQDTIGSDSDEDDDQAIKNITGDLQFGGLSRDDSGLSWKDKMKDIIADSKKMKYERQAQKEKVVETTNELDSIWKTVVPSMKTVMQRPPPNRKTSNYMQLFHNLVMEQKSAGATDKMKTEEEKAKEEAEKLQLLEAQRLSRMSGDSEKQNHAHVSADDLNDCFSLDKGKRVSFHDSAYGDDEEENVDVNQDKEASTKNEDEEDGSDESDEEEGNDNDSDDDDDDEEEDASDNYSDLASDDNNDDEDIEEAIEESEPLHAKKKDSSVKSILKKSEQKKQVGKSSLQPASAELPYVFPAPGNYEELKSLLHGHNAEEQATILSRLRKCHHPSLAEGNKDKLQKVLQFLWVYFGELVSEVTIDKPLVNCVSQHLWEMTQMFPASTATHLQKFMLERQKEHVESFAKRKGQTPVVSIDVLLHLPLIGSIFPTSDYRHPVTTPAISLITQMLSDCYVRHLKDCIIGLFMSSQALEFVELSKRYIPEVMTFLHGLLVLGMDENEASGVSVFPPLKTSRKHDVLQVKEKCSEAVTNWSLTEVFSMDSSDLDDDKFRCGAMTKCILLLQQCVELWADVSNFAAVMRPIKEPLSMLPVQNYPEDLKTSIQQLKSKIRQYEAKKLHAMQIPSKRPEPLKLFEPKMEEFWSGKKKKGGPNKQVNERQRLNHKIKREMKAAVREIKRDNEVLAAHQLDVITKKDADRKRKTKDLMNSLANQEGDYKAIKRGKH